jgi:glycine cleavage system H protein
MPHVPEDLKYTEQHEWVSVDGDIITMGITDFAQDALGDLAYVELPEVGKSVKAGDAFLVVESVKSASDVYAPVSGEVVAVNDALEGEPQRINESPYEAGWLCKIKASDVSELDALLDAAAYEPLAA